MYVDTYVHTQCVYMHVIRPSLRDHPGRGGPYSLSGLLNGATLIGQYIRMYVGPGEILIHNVCFTVHFCESGVYLGGGEEEGLPLPSPPWD